MELINLRDHLQHIKKDVPLFRDKRVEWAYVDLLNSVNFANEIADDVNDKDIFELATKGELEKLVYVKKRYYQQAILLKSSYLFASMFVSILIGELTNNFDLSLLKFLDKPVPPIQLLSAKQILPAYCVVVYRNKVITHHNLIRMNPNAPSISGNRVFLVPFPEDLHITEANVIRIQKLKEKYEETIEELHNEKNVFNLNTFANY